MRVYTSCVEMLDETYRELWKRSQRIQDSTVQGKKIESDDYEQKEIMFYNYRVDNFDDLSEMLDKAKEISGKEHLTMETAEAWFKDMVSNETLKENWWDLHESTKAYYKKFCSENEKGESAYSYGERIIPQLQHVINRFKGNTYCRGAQILMGKLTDAERVGRRVPCTISYHFIARPTLDGDRLNLILTQRSGDLMNFFPLDFAKAVLLLKHIAKETGIKPGYIIHSINSLHVYAIDYPKQYTW